MQVVVLLAMMGALYAFMIVPQQRRAKAHQALVRSIQPGDVVVTNSGIYGAVAEVEDDVVWLEVAPEVELKIARSAIAERVTEADAADDDDDDEVDGDDGVDEVMAEADSDDSDA